MSASEEPLGADERAELERLRALAEAQAGGSPSASGGTPRRGGWLRTTAAVLLITLGAVLAPLAVVAVWASSQITDTDRYVETVAPIGESPAVQTAITNDITNAVVSRLDVAAITTRAVDTLASRGILPAEIVDQLKALAGPVSNGVTGFVHDEVAKVVTSSRFSDAWVQANRVAHQEVVGALTGEGAKSVAVENGTVTVDLAPIVDRAKARLVARGFSLAEKIPEVDATFVVLDSPDITKVQSGLRLLNTLGPWLPFIALVVLAAGVYAARNHRLAVVGAGLGVAAAMVIVGVGLLIARRAYLDAVPAAAAPGRRRVIFDAVVRFLREAIRAAGVLGLVVALGAFFTGPSVAAVTVRDVLVRGTGAIRRGIERLGVHLDPVTRWAAPKRTILRAACVLIAAVVLIIWNYPSPALVLWVSVGVLGGLFLVQLLATPLVRPPAGQAALAQS